MILYTLSMPVIDYRAFLLQDTHKLDVAQFPRNWNDNSFLRGFGRFGVRTSPSDEIPFSEKKYAKANNGLQLSNLKRIVYGCADIVPSCVFRRVFFDLYSARFDIGLCNVSSNAGVRARSGRINGDDITNTVKALINANIYLPRFSKQGAIPFHKIGEYLLSEYLVATTLKPHENLPNINKKCMAVGSPVVVVEVLERELFNKDILYKKGYTQFHGIPDEWGVKLGYRTITPMNIPVYVLIRKRNAQKEKVRALRINLLKYHQERETLNAVMKLLAREDRNLSSINISALGRYLDTVTAAYSRGTREGIRQSTLLEIMMNVEKDINHDEYFNMLKLIFDDDRLSFLYKRFQRTVENLFGVLPNNGDHGDFNKNERSHSMDKKVFISHSSCDRLFAKKLVRFLEALGIKEQQIICTSVAGHGIPLNKDIYDYLREQFHSDLYVLFVLSKSYYDSAACLNEMGAAWVTRAKSTAILLPNFSFKEIKGAIDPRKISIKLDEEDRNQVVSLLRCLRDELQQEFGLDKVSEEKWADCWQQLLTTDT